MNPLFEQPGIAGSERFSVRERQLQQIADLPAHRRYCPGFDYSNEHIQFELWELTKLVFNRKEPGGYLENFPKS